jgi:hypothetical protein
MFLDYFALAMVLVSIIALVYIFAIIHDIPHRIAKQRNHPQQDAIHVACWLSLITLHALWPLVFIWAVAHKENPSKTTGTSTHGNAETASPSPEATLAEEVVRLKRLVSSLETRLRALEGSSGNAGLGTRERETIATAGASHD